MTRDEAEYRRLLESGAPATFSEWHGDDTKHDCCYLANEDVPFNWETVVKHQQCDSRPLDGDEQRLLFGNGTERNGRTEVRQSTTAKRLKAIKAELTELREQTGDVRALLTEVRKLLVEQRVVKQYYTTAEVAERLGKAKFTVREWCRKQRVRAEKVPFGRGQDEEWRISHEELQRIENEGLLPPPDRYRY